MAQRQPPNNNQPTILIISNAEFKADLVKRIEIGEELINRPIRLQEELEILHTDYDTWNSYNNEYLKVKFNIAENEYRKSYAGSGYSFLGQMGEDANPHTSLKNLIRYKLSDLKILVNKAELIKSEHHSPPKPLNKGLDISKTDVFIVHGHDDTAKIKVARFIEKLGFNPIILHEQTSSGKTIIEKIEQYSNVGFGIVLYTPCDVGSKKEDRENLNPRARQNVVFEHGFLIGKIGRSNVCALVKDEVEKPNDISGVVYVKMDDDDAWHLIISKELRSSGYSVDMNKL